ncbi:ABC transporter ATP-binding protein [Xylocopilactobacillus apis]|uniref:ABC transporter ATP-binding protein n=1 Tax=Xylocopilactobacillus apis TaxID=2932183 RepID=A0AAU9DBY9_9LACO|nr:ABC transporter ATP-binding protein [Xylocopilactobacillus apis]BDR55681.1 ABC transporter ATP-binding protein [Xylocopilactobacillus apis]
MILKIDNLTKIYGKRTILDQLSLSVEEPQIIALVAPNGTGKTTFLNIMCDLEGYQSGSIEILGLPNTDRHVFSEMTFMQDNSILYDELTGMDHMKFIASMYHKTQADIAKVAQLVGVEDYLNKAVGKYSLGMKQHLLFAMGILPEPKVFLLDEPLNGLDPDSVINVRNILKEMADSGTTILFSSHNLGEVVKLTDNILFLHEGKLKSEKDIFENEERWTLVVESVDELEQHLLELSLEYQILNSHKIEITTTEDRLAHIRDFLQEQNLDLWDVTKTEWDLEQVYLDLFERTSS